MELFEYVNTVNKAYKKYEAEGFNDVRIALDGIGPDPLEKEAFLVALATLEEASVETEQGWAKRYSEPYTEALERDHMRYRRDKMQAEIKAVEYGGNAIYLKAMVTIRSLVGTNTHVELRKPFGLRDDTKALVIFGDYKYDSVSYHRILFLDNIYAKALSPYQIETAAKRNGLEISDLTNSKYLDLLVENFKRNGLTPWTMNFNAEQKKSQQLGAP
jgi:hypothetical protein